MFFVLRKPGGRNAFLGVVMVWRIVVCCLLLTGQVWAAGEVDYRIGIGDEVEVQVWQEPDLSRVQRVRLDGRISLPLVGDVVAVGKTPMELDLRLEKEFARMVTEPAVSVLLVESRSRRYYVVGRVNQPGEFPLEYPLTILQAIARSGGFQEWAKRDQIRIVRQQEGQEVMLAFDYEAMVKGNPAKQNIMVVPGDTIIIP